MKKFLAIALAVIIACVAFVGCSANKGTDDTTPNADGKIDVKVVLVLEDKTEKTYDIRVTDGATAREALIEGGLVGEDQESAFLIETIDGNTAAMADGVLWVISDENDEQIGSWDDVTLSAGDTLRLVYTVAPNFDD